MANNAQIRLYQSWKGSNRFLCGGRIICGPDVASVLLSVILIAGPGIAFCVKMYTRIKHGMINEYPILVLGAFLTVLDLMFLFFTAGRDPGIVPRNSKPPESEELFDMPTPSMEWINGRTPYLKTPRTKDVIVNGHTVKVKYCDTCLLYRSPRVSHCSICNNCVQRFDHHCPWVGQCIGMRNYRFFFMFISTSTILCTYVFVFSWRNILEEGSNIWKVMSNDVLSDFLILYCFVAFWFVGGLTAFHLYLISTNQTTYENFRYKYDRKENPYTKGMIKNLKEAFFSKIPPSINFRSIVEDDDLMVSAAQNFEDGIASSKEKIDIEMGAKLGEDSGFTLPEMLRNFDHIGHWEDHLKSKEEEGIVPCDPDPFYSVEQDPKEHDEARESLRSSTVVNETGATETTDTNEGADHGRSSGTHQNAAEVFQL